MHVNVSAPAAGRFLAWLTCWMAAVTMTASMTSCRARPHGRTGGALAGGPQPCTASMLRGIGGRQGENTGARGDIEITNAASVPCALHGIPRLAIARARGPALAVPEAPPVNPASGPLILAAGQRNAALLTVYWRNWCGPRPGPLRVRLTLPGSGGTMVIPFDGPPAYNYVPACLNPNQASTIAVVSAYSRAPDPERPWKRKRSPSSARRRPC